MGLSKIKANKVILQSVTTAERDAIVKPAGEYPGIFNSDTNQEEQWDGNSWVNLHDKLITVNRPNYDYHEAQQLSEPYVDISLKSQIEADMNDAVLGGSHAHLYIEDVGKWFVFTRSSATKVLIYDDINDLTSKTVIDVSEPGYGSGVESASYNSITKKIYFSLSDGAYTATNSVVKEINIYTNAVVKVIDYDTGVIPGATVVVSVGDYIYVAEGNYAFTLNRFTVAGAFVDSIASGMSATVGAHGWAMDSKHLYITSFINYFDENWVSKFDLDTFTLVESYNYAVPNADTGVGGSIFTNQIAISGQYLYIGTEKFPNNNIYKVNTEDLTDFTPIDIMKTNLTSDLWFTKAIDNKIYYGGADNTIGYIDQLTDENVLLENSFPYSINQVNSTKDVMLFSGFDVYPVTGTGYVGKGVVLTVLKSSREVLHPAVGTGTAIDMSNPMITYYNMSVAGSATTYTMTGEILGGKAKCLINAATEPTVTGATKISGATFVVSTNMYMNIENNGVGSEFYFSAI